MPDGMRLIRARVENSQRISLADVRPNGEHCVVEGANESGKSSFLNAICSAIAGKKLMPEKPIAEGSARARVRLDLGEIEIERTITSKSDTVTVWPRGRKDEPFPRPQEFLDGLFALVAFDPSRFDRMKPAEQAALLRELAGLDTSDLDEQRDELYRQRTDIGRDAKRARGYLDSLDVPLDAPDSEVSVGDLSRELLEVERQAREAMDWKRRLDDLAYEKARLEGLIADLQEQLDSVISKGRQHMKSKPGSVPDPAPIRERIERAEELNRMFRLRLEAERASAEADKLQAEYEELTGRIQQIDAERSVRLQKAQMPIDGLSIEGDTVMFEGIPLSGASQSQRLRVLAAIGSALNPRAEFCILRDAAFLDPDTMRAFLEEMTERGVQVIAERPGRDEFATIVFEAGRVIDDGAPEPDESVVRVAEPEAGLALDVDEQQGETQTSSTASDDANPFDGIPEAKHVVTRKRAVKAESKPTTTADPDDAGFWKE